ncbi:MAG: ROK family transcriptional regulator [Pirellulaceae bacterium]|nr:ROK family transcriptional regulator [Pirellulaceae bacterium]
MSKRSVIRVIQQHGPCSRADVTRRLNVTAPTVSKAVAALMQGNFVEEFECKDNAIGRPAKRLRLATQTAQVLGLVLDASECRLVSAGIDGEVHRDSLMRFETPQTYGELISTVTERAQQFLSRKGVTTLGLGISIPGLVDYREQKGLLSPNLPFTNGQSPARDLRNALGCECVILQEAHALCAAERHYGDIQKLADFAILDVSTGLGLGVVSGGRVITGHKGLAGEIGHIPHDPNGRLCGCGNRGCLETVASDSALAWMISQRIGRDVGIEEVLSLTDANELSPEPELQRVLSHISFALTTVINLFNPSTLFIYGRLFELSEDSFDRLLAETGQNTLAPALADCQIVRTRRSKSQGAIAGVLEHLTDSLAPSADSFLSYLHK